MLQFMNRLVYLYLDQVSIKRKYEMKKIRVTKDQDQTEDQTIQIAKYMADQLADRFHAITEVYPEWIASIISEIGIDLLRLSLLSNDDELIRSGIACGGIIIWII